MADFLSSSEATQLRADVKAAVETTALTTAITYTAVSARSFNPSTGAVTDTDTDTALNAFVQPIKTGEVEGSKGRYMLGDLVCVIAVDRISEPNENDSVTVSGTTHRIVGWHHDSLKARYRLMLRKV